MDKYELLKELGSWEPSEQFWEELKQRLIEIEKKFEQERIASTPDEAWYNRRYDI